MTVMLFIVGIWLGGFLAWDGLSRKRLRSHKIAYRAGYRHGFQGKPHKVPIRK